MSVLVMIIDCICFIAFESDRTLLCWQDVRGGGYEKEHSLQ